MVWTPYIPQTWSDTSGDPNAQVNAERMGHIEAGIKAESDRRAADIPLSLLSHGLASTDVAGGLAELANRTAKTPAVVLSTSNYPTGEVFITFPDAEAPPPTV